MPDPANILTFWLEEVGPDKWYRSSAKLDAQIRERFEPLLKEVVQNGSAPWACDARGALALVILLDQFPRNMYRGTDRAFASDKMARAIAKKAIDKGWDLRTAEPQRQFFYMPLMHSECLGDQERCVRLMQARMADAGAENLLHAKAHREVIRRFGRFPHRNNDLGRAVSVHEAEFLEEGGYGHVVSELRQSA